MIVLVLRFVKFTEKLFALRPFYKIFNPQVVKIKKASQ